MIKSPAPRTRYPTIGYKDAARALQRPGKQYQILNGPVSENLIARAGQIHQVRLHAQHISIRVTRSPENTRSFCVAVLNSQLEVAL
jgi:hypothetical protein